MRSIRVESNIVTGHHSGTALPVDNIEIDDAMFATLQALRDQASQTQSRSRILWNTGVPTLEVEARPTISIQVNGSTNDAEIQINTAFVLAVATSGSFTGNRVLPFFGRRFRFSFTNGSGAKSISISQSGLYPIGHAEEYVLNRPLTLDIVE